MMGSLNAFYGTGGRPMLETILVTGFGPFGEHARNVSEEAVRQLDGTELEGFVLRAVSLPSKFEPAVAALEELIEAERPAAVLSFGISNDPDSQLDRDPLFRVELCAKNERQDGVVEDAAPAMVFSTLPVAAIKQAFGEAGLPTELSEDAGRTLCNALFYWTVRHVASAGFIHVPPAPERLEDVARAVRLAAEVTARRLIAQRVEATA
jgi:pyroglutamyl-peptidase